MENEDFTTNLNKMLDSKDVSHIQMASSIIKAQPNLINKNSVHWYTLSEIIDLGKSVKYAELYCSEGKSDKVYILNIQEDKGNYSLICYYGRRGKTIMSGLKYSGLYMSYAESNFYRIMNEKIKKGYIKLNSI